MLVKECFHSAFYHAHMRRIRKYEENKKVLGVTKKYTDMVNPSDKNFFTQLKFYKHITNYNAYKLRYHTTKTMQPGAKYYVYPTDILKVIESYIKLHITITENGIIEYKLKKKIQVTVACTQIK